MNNAVLKTNHEKYMELMEALPDFMEPFLTTGLANKSILTKLAYARDIKFFLEYAVENYPHFPDKQIKEITLEDFGMITVTDINRFISWMSDEKHSYALRTQARRKSAISVLYDYIINTEKKLSFNPVIGSVGITPPSKEFVTYLKMDEQKQLLDTIRYGTGLTKKQLEVHDRYKKRDLAIVFMFLDTGLRVSELCSLDVKDLVISENLYDPDASEYYVSVLRKGKKTSKTLSKVFFSDESREYVDEYLLSREATGEKFDDGSPLFISREGNRLSVREVEKLVKKYVRAALGRSDISVHKLRSSFAMEFYKSTKDILVLQSRMGHSSIAATNIYAKASEREESVKATRNWR